MVFEADEEFAAVVETEVVVETVVVAVVADEEFGVAMVVDEDVVVMSVSVGFVHPAGPKHSRVAGRDQGYADVAGAVAGTAGVEMFGSDSQTVVYFPLLSF
ncbi:MAG: hypothetical protein QXR64_08635 [Pyrobaculum sp.]